MVDEHAAESPAGIQEKSMASDSVTLVVLSTDSFGDCWKPFFTLLEVYWPEFNLPILLATETREYQHDDLSIRSTCAQHQLGSRPSWTQSLLVALEMVDTPLVLMTLDDFFLDGRVDVRGFERLIDLMLKYEYPTVALTEHGTRRPAVPSEHPELLEVDPKACYRLTTSPALWDPDVLGSYTHQPENAWQFEIFGSWRARRRKDRFFIANPTVLGTNGDGVFPYFQSVHDTGIVKGAWQEGIPDLFAAHGIDVDYSKRGFFEESGWIANKVRTLRKATENPRNCLLGGSLRPRPVGA